MKFDLETTIRSEIPVLEISAAQPNHPGARLPVVFYMHGFGSYKERKLDQGYYLAKAGFFTVLFDAPLHGRRITGEFASLPLVDRQSAIYDIIVESSGSLNDLIRSYQNHPVADISRTALVGSSMGGMTIFHYLVNHRLPEVKAASPIISTPCWEKNLRKKILHDLRLVSHFPDERLKGITQNDPVRLLKRLADFPLLIQNGVDDEVMPIEEIREFRKKLEPRYRKKELIEFIEYYNVGHEATDEMICRAAEWIRAHV